MKHSFAVLAGVAAVTAAVPVLSSAWGASGSLEASREAALLRLPPAAAPGQTVLYGHVTSLRHKGGRYEMRFDPALLLHGATAERAAFEDTGSSDVPNDYYVLEQGHRQLTYVVAATARVTVLTRGLDTITISVPEFTQILQGKNPRRRPLFGRPKDFGFWIRIGTKYPNPVLSLDEQYQP